MDYNQTKSFSRVLGPHKVLSQNLPGHPPIHHCKRLYFQRLHTARLFWHEYCKGINVLCILHINAN